MDHPAALPGFAPMDYHALRMRHARVLLVAFLRRWGVYGVVAAAVLGAGSNSPWQIVEGAAVAVVLPLFDAASMPGQLAAWALAYAAAGALPVLLTRPLWWPRRWAMAERALPLSPQALRRSDARLLPWLMSPWLAVQALGVAALWRHDPAPLHATRALALAAWLLATLVAAVLSLSWMGALRRTPRPAAARQSVDARATRAPAGRWHAQHWSRTLVWRPLWRGPAQRAGRTGAGLLLAQAASAGLLAGYPVATGWWLALLSLVALAGTSALRVRLRDDLAGLWTAARPLPLAPPRLQRAAANASLLPSAIGLLLTMAALNWPGARAPVAVAWAAVLAGTCLIESRPPPADPSHHAARWLFSLVLAWALGFEVGMD